MLVDVLREVLVGLHLVWREVVLVSQAENHLVFAEHRHTKVGQSHLQEGQSVTLSLLRVQREKLLGDRLEAELVKPARLCL